MAVGGSPPIQRYYDLADLSEAGDEVAITAKPADLPRLAEWAGVESIDRFEGAVTLRRLSFSRFHYQAILNADVVQNCVISLEPVRTHLQRRFSRVLYVVPHGRYREPDDETGGVLTLAAGDDDTAEEIESPRYDLAGPLLEEFSLGIDPYPRAHGVEFTASGGGEREKESPFAVLRRLKGKGS